MEKKFIDFIKESHNVFILNVKNNYITYLNTFQFIISNNYYGLIAIGERHYNYEKKCSQIEYNLINENVLNESEIKKIIKKYEIALKVEKVEIKKIDI